MRLLVAAALALSVMAPLAPAGAGAVAPTGPGAVWVWTAPPAEQLLGFAVRQGLDEVFLATPTEPTAAESRRIRRSVRALHGAAVRPAALGGDVTWVKHPERALAWARGTLATAPVDGLHLDVEPHGLPGWSDPATRQRLMTRYLELLDQVRSLALAAGVPVEVDVQLAYGSHTVGGENFADAILARVDGVTVMSYRDRAYGPNGLLAVSADWRRRGVAAGVPVRLAVETNPSAEGEHVTFAEEGRAAMLRVVDVVTERVRHEPTHAGFAVHDLDGWRALGP